MQLVGRISGCGTERKREKNKNNAQVLRLQQTEWLLVPCSKAAAAGGRTSFDHLLLVSHPSYQMDIILDLCGEI